MKHDIPHYIYMLINPLNHYPFYIGLTNSVEFRYEQHLVTRDGAKRASIIKYLESLGRKPQMIILEKKANRKQAKIAELFWIELFASRGIPIVNKEVLGSLESVSFHTQNWVPSTARPASIKPEPTFENAVPIKHAQRPENHGKPWTEAEVKLLEMSFLAGMPVAELASSHKRTFHGIVFQLQKLAHTNDTIRGKLADNNLLKAQEAYRGLAR